MSSSSKLVQIIAFFRRCLRRQVGEVENPSNPDLGYLSRTAVSYLENLSKEPGSLSRQVAIENLQREYNLLSEDYVDLPPVLELQLEVLRLSLDEPALKPIQHRILLEPPVAKLFAAITQHVGLEGVQVVTIHLGAEKETAFRVTYDDVEVMKIPISLRDPLRGFAKRAEVLGYDAYRRQVSENYALAQNGRFAWSGEDFMIELAG